MTLLCNAIIGEHKGHPSPPADFNVRWNVGSTNLNVCEACYHKLLTGRQYVKVTPLTNRPLKPKDQPQP